ncbi:hypothetical protein ACWEV3_32440 [Saccharopolyspora sp. NPDC003752]
MSFEVDTEALKEFSDFLHDCSRDVHEMFLFCYDEADLGVHKEGFINILMSGHSDVLHAMSERTALLQEVLNLSGGEIGNAAYFYDETDESETAELDASYPEAKTQGSQPPVGPTIAGGFAYQSVLDELKTKKDPAELEPKASEVEQWCRKTFDNYSAMAAVRALFKELFEVDPIDWVLECFIGEWKAWAKCALAWEACSVATKGIAENFTPALVKLPEIWEGNAAETAADYFSRLQQAILTESEAFHALGERYKLYMEMVYEVQMTCNDAINTIIDLALDALLLVPSLVVDVVTGGEYGLTLQKIFDIVGNTMTAVTAAFDACRYFETIFAASDLPGCPRCELEKLPGDSPSSHSYEHPDSSV